MADITKINVNSTAYNLKDQRFPDLNSSTTQYLRGDGIWAVPTVSTISSAADVTDEGDGMIVEPGSLTPSASINLQDKTNIQPGASNQTITADSGYDGLNSVQINGDSNLVAGNIVEGVSIFGVAGSVEVGLTNVAIGNFTTSSTTGSNQTVTIPYTGSGYPIACMVFIAGGAYNSDISGWYNTVQRYAVGQWTMHKSVQTSSPTYTTSGTENRGVVTAIYKNSTSSSTSYTRTSAMSTNVFSSSNASSAAATCVRFKSSTQMSLYVASSSYGLLAGTEYTYIVVYSS